MKIKRRIRCEDGSYKFFGYVDLIKITNETIPEGTEFIDDAKIASLGCDTSGLCIDTCEMFSVVDAGTVNHFFNNILPELFKKGYRLENISFYEDTKLVFIERMKELMKEG